MTKSQRRATLKTSLEIGPHCRRELSEDFLKDRPPRFSSGTYCRSLLYYICVSVCGRQRWFSIIYAPQLCSCGATIGNYSMTGAGEHSYCKTYWSHWEIKQDRTGQYWETGRENRDWAWGHGSEYLSFSLESGHCGPDKRKQNQTTGTLNVTLTDVTLPNAERADMLWTAKGKWFRHTWTDVCCACVAFHPADGLMDSSFPLYY